MTKPKKVFITGNEAMAEAAIQAGCRFYAGYPITPQNEIPAYMSKRMPEVNGVFIQAESELAAVNMVYGASAAGARALTTSSSPGISLKQEGISYIAGSELPVVIINVMRGGPGLGNIAPSQADYFQATKGGGHGDYRLIVLAPSTLQEAFDLTIKAFNLADKYRNPVMILADGMLGQMMEPVILKAKKSKQTFRKPWALTGAKGRKPNIARSFYIGEGVLEKFNKKLENKYKKIQEKETRLEQFKADDAEIILVAFGSMARITKSVVTQARKIGLKVGLIRPVSLWPFDYKTIARLTKKADTVLVVEMNMGQMLEDVRLAVDGAVPIRFLGRSGGGMPTEEEILKKIRALAHKK